jgi:hypothetical protein
MLRLALFVLAGLVGLVVLVTVVGWCLPKGHHATRSKTIAASAERVFGYIADVANGPTWRKDVRAVEIVSGAGVGMIFRETSSNGVITYRVDALEPARRFVTVIADPSLPFSGRWTFELSPRGDTTDVTITEDGEVSNPIFRFMSRVVYSQTATMERYLAALDTVSRG